MWLHCHALTAIISCICIAGATTAIAVSEVHIPQVIDVATQSGCGSIGPLGPGHFRWYIVVSCQPGARLLCQAMDGGGCEPGIKKKIGSLEVDDPDDTYQIASEKFSNSVTFVCPFAGKVRCQANFEDSDDGPNYSLRVVS